MADARVLIVEDEEVIAGEIRSVLAHLGYSIVGIATSGEEAITRTEATTPDLVLMDIFLEGDMDGINAAAQIRNRFDIPVIYLTGHDEATIVQQIKGTEPFGYILKPFNRRELHITIEIALCRHDMESKLREAEEKFRAINEAALDAIVMTDHNGHICLWNPAAEQMFGYTMQEAVGQELSALIAPQRYYEMYRQKLRDYMTLGQGGAIGKMMDLSAVKHDGTEFPIELSLSAVNLKGKWNAIGIIRDVTLHRQTETQLRDLNRQLQKASRHKSDFLANMSHELRTPLNAMIGYTSLTLSALKNTLPSEHFQNLTRAEQSARVLLQLINDVLDFSKIEAGRLETFIEEIDLDELLEEVVITAEGLLSNPLVELKEEFAKDLPIIESDYTRLKQILDNLVGNALKFTSEGYVAIRAMLVNATHSVRIEVEDTGCGIPDELMGRIFELFRQADGSIKKKFGGTGLGLAISKRLSDMLGIQIGVESEVEKGTTFWLKIPVRPKAEIEPSPATKRAEDVPQTHEPATFPDPPSIDSDVKREGPVTKALVLGFCDKEMCLSLDRHLAGLPLEIHHVTAVDECVEKSKIRLVWTIVLEANEQGFEILAHLKNEPALKDVPIIMSSTEAAHHGFHVGPVEYLEKPFENKTLLNALVRITRVQQGDILIVDDDPSLRSLYERVLAEAGYTIYVAANGIEALEQLREHQSFQAIMLDLMMPGMDGFQVLEQIQQNQEWRRIPVVVVTAKHLSPRERDLLREGTQLFLDKEGFSIDELSKRIKSVTQSVALGATRSILVIDDNAINLNLISSVFEMAGYTVYQAISAREGIATARSVLPDTVLMDLAMPGIDGFEATQILKQDPETADMTVIACSAFTTGDYQERAFQVGCEGYITKPIEPNRLVEQVTKLVLASKIKKKMASIG